VNKSSGFLVYETRVKESSAMKNLVPLVVAIGAAIGTVTALPRLALADSPPWPAEQKQEVIAGCRKGIIEHAEQDYLTRNGLTELPAGFREKTAAAMEPFLAICDCMMNNIEKDWPLDYVLTHPDEWASKVQQLVAGVCKAKVSGDKSIDDGVDESAKP
jgi:hypothetical protein